MELLYAKLAILFRASISSSISIQILMCLALLFFQARKQFGKSFYMFRAKSIFTSFTDGVNKKKCLFITDIYKSNYNNALWRNLSPNERVAVDMMFYGIWIYDDKLQKEYYRLNI